VTEALEKLAGTMGGAIAISPGPRVELKRPGELHGRMQSVARAAATGGRLEKSAAHWLIREVARQVDLHPASINELYLARGRGETRDDFTVPAMNLRALPFFAARAVFRAGGQIEAGALVFEIARSEIGYTDQRPAEYASAILAAALDTGWTGPIFIQGDHFQVSAKKHQEKPEDELRAVRELALEAVTAGFFNIDIDTSTLVDLSKPTTDEQQRTNYTRCAEFTVFLRGIQPAGTIISVGGEIGEVGGQNSTEPELIAFMEGYNRTLEELLPGAVGLSKISIQTGTSHGGVVLPDGTMAKVKVDFDTLARLSKLAKERFGLAGAVQHGASTLPEEAFRKFSEATACEVHLATNFQNMLFERLPAGLRSEIYDFLGKSFAGERKAGQTDDQFFYNTRKKAIGPYKAQLWDLPAESMERVESSWEQQFAMLFERLNLGGTRVEVERTIQPTAVQPTLDDYLRAAGVAEEVADLAD
jgi:fructose/tagatose bisphosphate aldolase